MRRLCSSRLEVCGDEVEEHLKLFPCKLIWSNSSVWKIPVRGRKLGKSKLVRVHGTRYTNSRNLRKTI